VTVNLSGPDGRSVWKEAYWYTFQETVDSLIWYSAIAKKYKASGNPLVQKFGGIMEKESHRASLII